ncbi:hypothetical protein FNV62_38095 [Streptomyces sp. RLB3-17]|nr:hypothetical protein FNV61_38775 [Streptomyces sp. RLB3-6]QDO01387.1 hypothetical protein FNV58_40150 [Streptomyces sp. RLB1-9]QDO11578.1 hypothetical protein FNV68_39875 [Streptomyces sp. S1D4-23]QDO23116.1 hypothetical protein FNV65_38725 [Streptomyces sp. S1A1-8]QDO33243.1 hypothetical protein FNV63_38750 [Streptomyces sp. S1A1-3]QDO43189.1 hypothetical protein FNV62_38095 [Streptomyces sp. RLB3-17]
MNCSPTAAWSLRTGCSPSGWPSPPSPSGGSGSSGSSGSSGARCYGSTAKPSSSTRACSSQRRAAPTTAIAG